MEKRVILNIKVLWRVKWRHEGNKKAPPKSQYFRLEETLGIKSKPLDWRLRQGKKLN